MFKTPPKPGSVVRTEILLRSSSSNTFTFEDKISDYGPYFVVDYGIRSYSNAGSMSVEVYLNDKNVGGRTF